MIPPMIIAIEHTNISENYDDFREQFGAWLTEMNTHHKRAKTLGLYEKKGGYAPGNFIGMVWLGEGENKTVLRVDSKFSEQKMDYIEMFTQCAAHPKIGGRMGGCLYFWADEELIESPRDNDFLFLTAIAYLRELNELCRRRLRTHFLREQQNFTGKIKGKILIGENLRQNIIRARPDRIFCEYQSVSDDILENRILRAALERAARYISPDKIDEENYKFIQQWIRASRAALHGVSITPVKPRDFSAARRRGVFSHYARPLALAKAVLLQLGFNPQEQIPEKTKTPPFALDSAELFERYAPLKLLEKYPKLKAPNDNIGGGAGDFAPAVRPDFYVAAEDGAAPQIIDAKYKRVLTREKTPAREDVFQIVAYSRNRGVRKRIECAGDGEVELALAYPFFGKNAEECKISGAYLPPLRLQKIKCPVKGEN